MKVMAFLLLLIIPVTAFGQQPLGPCVYPIKKGEESPYDGILYNYQADAVIQAELEYTNASCQTKEEFRTKRDAEKCLLEKSQQKTFSDSQINILNLSLANCDKEKKGLLDLLNKQRPPIVIRDDNSKLWMTIGIAIGAIIGGGSIYLYEKFK